MDGFWEIVGTIGAIIYCIFSWWLIIHFIRKHVEGENYRKKSVTESVSDAATAIAKVVIILFVVVLVCALFVAISIPFINGDAENNNVAILILGLIILAIFIIAWVAIAKSITTDDETKNEKVTVEFEEKRPEEEKQEKEKPTNVAAPKRPAPTKATKIIVESNDAPSQSQKEQITSMKLELEREKRKYTAAQKTYEDKMRNLEDRLKESEKVRELLVKELVDKQIRDAIWEDADDDGKRTNKKKTPTKAPTKAAKTPKPKVNSGPLYRIVNVKQGSDAWLKAREGKITGTSAHFLRDHNVPYVVHKNDYSSHSFYQSDSMIRGHELEPIGIARFAEEYNKDVKSVGFIVSTIYEHAAYSPDGVVYDENGKIKTIIEHKAFNAHRHYANYGQIENNILYQIQFGMFVTGARDAYLVLFNPDIDDEDDQLLVQYVRRNKDIQNLFKNRFENYRK